MVEATHWIRANPEKAADMMAEDPNLKNFPKATLLQQIKAYNLLYKPTYVYPHAKFWGEANEPIFNWLHHRSASRIRSRARISKRPSTTAS